VATKRDKDEDIHVVARNRRATFLYEIIERIEAGLALVGSEVKSVRAGKVTLSDSYATPKGRELYLMNAHIASYDKASIDGHDPLRPRKLLLHRRQIERLIAKVSERGLTLVPLQIYFRGSVAKVELGLGRGKHKYDKRRTMAERDGKREIERARASMRRGDA
jgi:SsrA-binding protein